MELNRTYEYGILRVMEIGIFRIGIGHTQNTLMMRHRDVIRGLIKKIFCSYTHLYGEIASNLWFHAELYHQF